MRTRSVILVLVLLVALVLPPLGCGTGGAGSPAGGVRVGPFVFALPFVPAAGGQSVTIGFKSVFGVPATVFVTHFPPGGGVGAPVPFIVPANGELRVPLSSIIGGAPGGWLCVDTRDVTTISPVTGEPSPVVSSGFVFPYIHRATIGGLVEEDTFEGVTSRATGVKVAVTPNTDTVQLINYSLNQVAGGAPAMPLAVTYAVSTFTAAGALVSTVPVAVPANGSSSFTPAVTTGSIRIEPMAPLPPPPAPPLLQLIQYAAVARESGLQTHAEHRFHETSLAHLPAQIEYGFEVEFGDDGLLNLHDFEFLMSNTTATTQTILLTAVYRKGQLPLLETPRAFALAGGRTVLMRTRTVDSIGLVAGEVSFFDDIFGDVFASTGFDEVTLLFQVPATIDVSARHYDPAFSAFYRVVRALPRTNVPCVYDLPIQEFLTTGLRNVVSITNPTGNAITIPVQGYTPGGTLYLLDPVTVGPRTRFDWTPDGLTFREVPTSTVLPFVKFMRFQFFPASGLYFRGRTTSSDALGLIRFVTPIGNRDN